jgi:ketosteroid isomerase-like protein
MARENVEVVRELYRGWARGDFGVGTEFFDPDIEFTSDFGTDRYAASGTEGMRRVWRENLRNWETWRTGDIQELRDLGDVIVAISPIHARGRHSGAEVEMPRAGAAFRFRDGQIVWLFVCGRAEDALEAVGLRE